MKVEVLVGYIKHDGERVKPGTVLEVSPQAVKNMLARGEVKAVKAPSKAGKTASKSPSKEAKA